MVHLNNKVGEYMKSCFLFGHADAPNEIMERIERTVDRFYQELGIRQFYVGGYGAFDRMVASAVKVAKRKYGDISLFLVTPYHPAERPIELTPGFDGTFYPPLEDLPRRYAIVRANRYMVETSDAVICYVWHGASNTQKLLAYAQRREKKGLIQIENLAEIDLC